MENTLTIQDIEFLKELQHELNNQSSDGNADPVYWGIAEEKQVPAFDGCGDYYIISGGYEEDYTLQEAKDYAIENELATEDEINKINCEDDMADFLNDKEGTEKYKVFSFTTSCNVVSRETGCFLTHRACQKHIDLFGYNYSKPHTFALTAIRNPEFERVIKILKTIDWEKIGQLQGVSK